MIDGGGGGEKEEQYKVQCILLVFDWRIDKENKKNRSKKKTLKNRITLIKCTVVDVL